MRQNSWLAFYPIMVYLVNAVPDNRKLTYPQRHSAAWVSDPRPLRNPTGGLIMEIMTPQDEQDALEEYFARFPEKLERDALLIINSSESSESHDSLMD